MGRPRSRKRTRNREGREWTGSVVEGIRISPHPRINPFEFVREDKTSVPLRDLHDSMVRTCLDRCGVTLTAVVRSNRLHHLRNLALG
jgi:hypothetical protein